MPPKITIITPVFNHEKYIEETIESVLAQDYPSIEYIVLNDGSTDGTLAKLEKYKDRITIVSHPNMGESKTVNKGFDLATGELICVVSSDDPLLPGAITRIIQILENRKEYIGAYPDSNFIDSSGKIISVRHSLEYNYESMVRDHLCIPGACTIFRRAVIDRIGGRDSQFKYVGDMEFWFRAGLLGDFYHIPEVLATHRIHPQSTSVHDRGPAMANEHFRMMKKYYSMAGLPRNIINIKREAIGSTYLTAGIVLGKMNFFLRHYYFLNAIFRNPLKYMGPYKRRFRIMYPFINRFI